jgi:hypothetical protein
MGFQKQIFFLEVDKHAYTPHPRWLLCLRSEWPSSRASN